MVRLRVEELRPSPRGEVAALASEESVEMCVVEYPRLD